MTEAPDETPVPTAVVGYGRMGRFLGQAVASAIPHLKPVALIEPTDRGRAHFAEDFGYSVPAYDDLETALSEVPARACLIATPTPSHGSLVEAALLADWHVFCEKPLTLDPAESARLATLASARSLILQVGFFRRHSTPWLRARELLRAGAIGQLSFIRSTTWDQVVPPLSFLNPRVSGGLLVDNGVHEFDLVSWLADAPIHRVAALYGPDGGHGLADVGDVNVSAALVELANGVPVSIDLSRNGRYSDDMRTEILGSDGAIFVDYHPHSRTRLGTAIGLEEIPESRVADGFLDGVVGELRAFLEGIRDDQPGVRPDGLDSARAVAAAHAAAEAVRSGQWVAVSPVGGGTQTAAPRPARRITPERSRPPARQS